jgi:hypothetical protein
VVLLVTSRIGVRCFGFNGGPDGVRIRDLPGKPGRAPLYSGYLTPSRIGLVDLGGVEPPTS